MQDIKQVTHTVQHLYAHTKCHKANTYSNYTVTQCSMSYNYRRKSIRFTTYLLQTAHYIPYYNNSYGYPNNSSREIEAKNMTLCLNIKTDDIFQQL